MNPRHLLLLTPLLSFAACSEAPPVGEFRPTSQGTLVATTRMEAGGAGPAAEIAGDREGILRKGGVLYYVKDRRATQLGGPQRVTRNLYLERDEQVTLADGRRFPIREGTMLTATGEVIDIPPYLR